MSIGSMSIEIREIASYLCCRIEGSQKQIYNTRKPTIISRLAKNSGTQEYRLKNPVTKKSTGLHKSKESMGFQKEYLDLVLVPSGLLIMFAYHLLLLHRCLNLPHKTVIGFENNDKRAWVERIMQADKRDVDTALTVIASNTSAATFLASISLTLSSLIGAWLGGSSNNLIASELIFGDTRPSTISIKYISLLVCFLLAFSCFVQSARHFVHANYLISTPGNDIPVMNVEIAVIRGGDFWSLGLRALYFALNLLLWFFGPIPMFASSVVMVSILHYLDYNSTPLLRHRPLDTKMVKRVGERISETAIGIEHHLK